jgi:hypothetical protein
MKKRKAVFLTLSLYTFLLWFYIAAQIIFNHGDRYFVGFIAFVLSMIFTYLFLTTN